MPRYKKCIYLYGHYYYIIVRKAVNRKHILIERQYIIYLIVVYAVYKHKYMIP
jgi:hypothetical protein